jgi:hypothetical protein
MKNHPKNDHLMMILRMSQRMNQKMMSRRKIRKSHYKRILHFCVILSY